MLTLDQIVERHKDRIKGRVIIKIDVQGHEASVLRGAACLLKRVEAVHVEVALFQYSGRSTALRRSFRFFPPLDFTLVPINSASGELSAAIPMNSTCCSFARKACRDCSVIESSSNGRSRLNFNRSDHDRFHAFYRCEYTQAAIGRSCAAAARTHSES